MPSSASTIIAATGVLLCCCSAGRRTRRHTAAADRHDYRVSACRHGHISFSPCLRACLCVAAVHAAGCCCGRGGFATQAHKGLASSLAWLLGHRGVGGLTGGRTPLRTHKANTHHGVEMAVQGSRDPCGAWYRTGCIHHVGHRGCSMQPIGFLSVVGSLLCCLSGWWWLWLRVTIIDEPGQNAKPCGWPRPTAARTTPCRTSCTRLCKLRQRLLMSVVARPACTCFFAHHTALRTCASQALQQHTKAPQPPSASPHLGSPSPTGQQPAVPTTYTMAQGLPQHHRRKAAPVGPHTGAAAGT